jgi:hypothetical protein
MYPLPTQALLLSAGVLLVGCSEPTSLLPGVRRDPPFAATAVGFDDGGAGADPGSAGEDAGYVKPKPTKGSGGGWWGGSGFHNRDGGTGAVGGSPDDAGSGSVEADAGTPSEDAGMAPPPADSFSCADFPSALRCTSFDSPQSSEFYLDSTTGDGTAAVLDGILDARTNGNPADAYAELGFSALRGGDVYFRLNARFPSDGDLTSVNFVTFGDYTDTSDYGVELDAVYGKLSFNSAQAGWTNGNFALQQDVWMCIDAHLHLDRYNGSMSVRVDGQSALEASGVNTLPRVGATIMHAGIDWTRRREQTGHVQVDNVVISLDPVPCP